MTDCRVLIVEDDADTREALAEVLEACGGFLIEQAGDGAHALARAAAGARIDVILLDLHLPDIQASELCEKLRASPACEGARVLLLTGDTHARLLDFISASKLLHKPITIDELEEAVREACAA
jgi:CheY-like chemotaxis protein